MRYISNPVSPNDIRKAATRIIMIIIIISSSSIILIIAIIFQEVAMLDAIMQCHGATVHTNSNYRLSHCAHT